MSFQASEGEFRNRFWIIAAIIWAGFLLYAVDHVNAAEALARLILRTTDESSAPFGHCITALFWFATLIVAIGALIRSWAESYLHSSIVHDAALHGEQLVADGPYRRVRNPLYLGNLFLAVGLGFLACRSGFFVISIGMFVFVYRLILREETILLQSQGESYRRYFEAVPRLFPALSPRSPRAFPHPAQSPTGSTASPGKSSCGAAPPLWPRSRSLATSSGGGASSAPGWRSTFCRPGSAPAANPLRIDSRASSPYDFSPCLHLGDSVAARLPFVLRFPQTRASAAVHRFGGLALHLARFLRHLKDRVTNIDEYNFGSASAAQARDA
jgi:protein-S-isoprenylcysteine O-methyltransferase Ste14